MSDKFSFVCQQPACPVCHLPLTIDLEAPALEMDENIANVRQGMLGRLNLDTWRSSSKIEALVEELSNLRLQDATTKSLVFSQFVNFLDLIAFRLQRAGFSVRQNDFSASFCKLTFKTLGLSPRGYYVSAGSWRHNQTL